MPQLEREGSLVVDSDCHVTICLAIFEVMWADEPSYFRRSAGYVYVGSDPF